MYLGQNLIVIGISPKNHENNVAIDSVIKISFSYILNPATINLNNIILFEKYEVQVERTLNYIAAKKILEVIPTQPLINATTYNLIIKGGDEGPKTHDGKILASQVISSFSTIQTSVVRPTLLYPDDQSKVFGVIKFEWEDTGVDSYKIQVASDVTFTNILWPTGPIEDPQSNSIIPDYNFEPAVYYWRVRSVRNGILSDWSSIFRFRIIIEGEEEGIDEDIGAQVSIESIPANKEEDVKLTISSIQLKFSKAVDPNQVLSDYIKITAWDIFDDPTIEEIDISFVNYEFLDGTIKFNLEQFYHSKYGNIYLYPDKEYRIFIDKDITFVDLDTRLIEDVYISFQTKMQYFYQSVKVIRSDIENLISDVSDTRLKGIIYNLSKELYLDIVNDKIREELDKEVINRYIKCYIRYEAERILISDMDNLNLEAKALADFSVRYASGITPLTSLLNLLKNRAQKCLDALGFITGKEIMFAVKRAAKTEPDGILPELKRDSTNVLFR